MFLKVFSYPFIQFNFIHSKFFFHLRIWLISQTGTWFEMFLELKFQKWLQTSNSRRSSNTRVQNKIEINHQSNHPTRNIIAHSNLPKNKRNEKIPRIFCQSFTIKIWWITRWRKWLNGAHYELDPTLYNKRTPMN